MKLISANEWLLSNLWIENPISEFTSEILNFPKTTIYKWGTPTYQYWTEGGRLKRKNEEQLSIESLLKDYYPSRVRKGPVMMSYSSQFDSEKGVQTISLKHYRREEVEDQVIISKTNKILQTFVSPKSQKNRIYRLLPFKIS